MQQSETRRVYDGMDVVQERDGTNTVTVNYTRDGNIGGLLARSTVDGHFFYHYDGSGNVTNLTDSTQAEVARYDYDAYGIALHVSGTQSSQPYRYSTKELHAASGLYDYGYRFYSPGMGRWINRDPIEEDDGLNLYAMVGNDPVNHVDEDGLMRKKYIKDLLQFFQKWHRHSAARNARQAQRALRPPTSPHYSSPFSVRLPKSAFKLSDGEHFARCNRELHRAFTKDPEFARKMEKAYPGIRAHVAPGARGAYNRNSPPGLSWHHDADNPGVIRLVPRAHHKAKGPVQRTLHPRGRGGREIWGGGRGGSGGGSGCFPVGTPILMPDGTFKPIEQIKKGDLVLSRDEHGTDIKPQRVLSTIVRTVTGLLILHFDDGEKITTTDEHPFYIKDKGFVMSRNLQEGMVGTNHSNKDMKIVRIERRQDTVSVVHNFAVDGYHTYFVGKSGIWVHNPPLYKMP